MVWFLSHIANNGDRVCGHRPVPRVPLSVSRVNGLPPCPEAFEGVVVTHYAGGAGAEKRRERKVKWLVQGPKWEVAKPGFEPRDPAPVEVKPEGRESSRAPPVGSEAP